jgi:hypothetical protein
MSLQKNIELDYGVDVNYHKIGVVYLYRNVQKMKIYVFSYKDQAAKEAGEPELRIKEFVQPLPDTLDPLLFELYNYIKTTDEFKDSLDV